jgi:two-component system phosphate regulon sensor histidine kinase PhoR
LKRDRPDILAITAAIVVALCINMLNFYLFKFNWTTDRWAIILSFLVTIIFTFFVFKWLVISFIYAKIKVVYKTLSSYKGPNEKGLTRTAINNTFLEDINSQVMEWDSDRRKEIEELKKTELFRKEFLGNVSHELKTPLFNIQGYIHTLLDGGLQDEKVNVYYLQRAAKSAERLCLIVDDLEAISKLESGELILDQRSFDVVELIRDVFDSLELQARDKSIQLTIAADDYTPIIVYGDKERIRQVFVNLIVNSIKYGRTGGKTKVSFHNFEENVMIQIADNGIGIETAHLPRLFERFYRVDKSRSRDAGGTGLGLAIVKHILEAHKQTITVRSSFGVGTTFTLSLQLDR